MACAVKSANHRSTRLSHEALVGVKCTWNRGCAFEPSANARVLVGPVVVADEVELSAAVSAVEGREEVDELEMRMLREAATVNSSARHLQRGEQAGGAVAFVVMSHARRQAWAQRQHRLSPIQGLDLRLLVHAQDQGALRRVQVQADDVGHLGLELGVGTELERRGSMRLQIVRLPDAMHARGADAHLLGQPPRTPVRGVSRRSQGLGDN